MPDISITKKKTTMIKLSCFYFIEKVQRIWGRAFEPLHVPLTTITIPQCVPNASSKSGFYNDIIRAIAIHM